MFRHCFKDAKVALFDLLGRRTRIPSRYPHRYKVTHYGNPTDPRAGRNHRRLGLDSVSGRLQCDTIEDNSRFDHHCSDCSLIAHYCHRTPDGGAR